MPIYRVHFMNEDGELQSATELEFAGEDAVIDHVGGFAHPHAMEIWDGDRCIAKFTATTKR
jgi:hypothetical protein